MTAPFPAKAKASKQPTSQLHFCTATNIEQPTKTYCNTADIPGYCAPSYPFEQMVENICIYASLPTSVWTMQVTWSNKYGLTKHCVCSLLQSKKVSWGKSKGWQEAQYWNTLDFRQPPCSMNHTQAKIFQYVHSSLNGLVEKQLLNRTDWKDGESLMRASPPQG